MPLRIFKRFPAAEEVRFFHMTLVCLPHLRIFLLIFGPELLNVRQFVFIQSRDLLPHLSDSAMIGRNSGIRQVFSQ